MDETNSITAALDAVGPRLKWLRGRRGMTLTALSETTGISKSTLSRLETGQRRPSLELLLPLAQAHAVIFGERLVHESDESGAQSVLKSLPAPLHLIAENAGFQGDVVVEKVKSLKSGFGLQAVSGEYVDMIEAGIIDPVKVTRSALQNAGSIAAMVLTTEAIVADKPEKKEPSMPKGGMGGMEDMY